MSASSADSRGEMISTTHDPAVAPGDLQHRLIATRMLSDQLAAPLSPEDMVVQAMDDASPAKWHLAHVSWFFETFILAKHLPGYKLCDERYPYCFNSYYEAAGPRHPRPKRGLLTRPSCGEVMAYRAHVDEGLAQLFGLGLVGDGIAALIEIGISHEQQHQELLLCDILAVFSQGPLKPAYREPKRLKEQYAASAIKLIGYDGGIVPIGHDGTGFAYDNEAPRHDALLQPYKLSDRLVTNADWIDFMSDGGYETPAHWLADGWTTVQQNAWQSPLYWEERDGYWWHMTLEGLVPVDLAAPVCHVSYYEADAYARWAGKRLPSEFEWEHAARDVAVSGNMLGTGALRPRPATYLETGKPKQMFGDVWEWTRSSYAPYPGYRAAPGALGEYNGKFMCSQYVLKGASCVTADGHSRASYRNFFYPHQRWQFMGLRLAEDSQ